MPSSLLTSFLGALQACVSVLLTLSYGAAARKLGLIQRSSIHDVSGLGMKVLLPALILVHLGEQLQLGNVLNYVPVAVWSITYTILSILLGRSASKLLNLPDWVTPTCAFNNTTSLPLLLLQSLESVGSLKMIVKDGESVSEAVARAQSYFLLCGVLSKTIGYVVGPHMLTGGDVKDSGGDGHGDGQRRDRYYTVEEGADEESPLLSRSRAQKTKPQPKDIASKLARWTKKGITVLSYRLKENILPPYGNPTADMAILCTLIGGVLGLVPQLHKAFFNTYEEGGIFNAWLTSSIKNVGKLFTTLQVFIVGCELGVSFEKMKGGNDNVDGDRDRDDRGSGGRNSRSTNPGVKAVLTIFLIRLVVWPVLSISLIYTLAKKTTLLRSDPVLWFSLMLMPAGPPALVIQGLAELAKASERTKMVIAKTLTIMYVLSPVISFTITGALKACQGVLDEKAA
ncbi:Auxin Efflux Carrier superfamily [Aspergillus undulatus]|uniref:Auxin Efflux Carrier superfamily n=1 Tax=Aspergillus undulatus TaxID=1810928 RepID=UPI003CCD465B